MAKVLVIINITAGGGRAARVGHTHVEKIRSALGGVSVVHTEGPGHATELAREAVAAGAASVIALGGDGTVFEVVNGLLADPDAAARPTLGLIPVGTGNSFVRDLGLSDPAAAAAAIVAGRTRAVDAVRLEHRDGVLHYVNLLSFGFSARAGELTNRRFKPLGAAGYVLAVLQCLITLEARRFPHRVGGDRGAGAGALDDDAVSLLSFCNSRYTGGEMMMAPGADIADGRVDRVKIGAMGRRRFLSSFPRIFRGTHPQMPEVEVSRVERVVFEGEHEVSAMIDGEILRLVPRALSVCPGVLEVYA